MGSCQCNCNCIDDKEDGTVQIERVVEGNPPVFAGRKSLQAELERAYMASLQTEKDSEPLSQLQALCRAYLTRQEPLFQTPLFDQSKASSDQVSVISECSEPSKASSSQEISCVSESSEASVGQASVLEPPERLLAAPAKDKHEQLGAYEFTVKSLPGALWKGPTRLADGSVYVGEWNEEGQPEGNGTMYYIDGGICEGQWKAGRLSGQGRRISPFGDVYTGQWQEGQKHGWGKMEFQAATNQYEGEWPNDLQHGHGEEVLPGGAKFKGQFCAGKKHGKGVYSWTDGSWYDGEFLDDQLEGFGIYHWECGREYRGSWKTGKMHGSGEFRWPDGRQYSGEYCMDQKEGWGVYSWPNGKRYEGYWKDGLQHGEGRLFVGERKGKTLRWEKGKPLR